MQWRLWLAIVGLFSCMSPPAKATLSPEEQVGAKVAEQVEDNAKLQQEMLGVVQGKTKPSLDLVGAWKERRAEQVAQVKAVLPSIKAPTREDFLELVEDKFDIDNTGMCYMAVDSLTGDRSSGLGQDAGHSCNENMQKLIDKERALTASLKILGFLPSEPYREFARTVAEKLKQLGLQ